MIEEYALPVLGIGIVLMVIIEIYSFMETRMERSIVQSLDLLAIEMVQGSSIETAMKKIGDDKSISCRNLYKRVIENLNKGLPLEKAIAATSDNIIFSSLSDVLSQPSEHAVSSLRTLSSNWGKVLDLESEMNAEVSYPVTLLQLLNIFLLPIFYIFLAGILSSNVVTISLSENLKLYLLAINIMMALLPAILLSKIKRSIYMLPLALSYYVLAFNTIGPAILKLI
jgi:hypothetical protein